MSRIHYGFGGGTACQPHSRTERKETTTRNRAEVTCISCCKCGFGPDGTHNPTGRVLRPRKIRPTVQTLPVKS